MKWSLLLLISLLPLRAHAGEFSDEFKRLRESADRPALEKFLTESATPQADNPDYYSLSANYWWGLSQQVVISTKPAVAGDFPLVSKKASEGGTDAEGEGGREVGSISTNGALDPSLKKRALDLATEGAKKFPQRLDLGFGKAWIEFNSGMDKEAVDTLCGILKVATAPGAELKWADNQPLPEPTPKFVPESIEGYTAPLFQKETPETDVLCKRLCDATIAAYPDHPYAYNILGSLAVAQRDFTEGIRILKIGESKAPKDAIILMNLADAEAKGDHPKDARATYEKILKLDGEQEIKAEAKEKIEALKKSEKR